MCSDLALPFPVSECVCGHSQIICGIGDSKEVAQFGHLTVPKVAWKGKLRLTNLTKDDCRLKLGDQSKLSIIPTIYPKILFLLLASLAACTTTMKIVFFHCVIVVITHNIKQVGAD